MWLQEEPRSDSYRHAVQPKAAVAQKKKKSKTKKDKKLELEELKQEVDMVSGKRHLVGGVVSFVKHVPYFSLVLQSSALPEILWVLSSTSSTFNLTFSMYLSLYVIFCSPLLFTSFLISV